MDYLNAVYIRPGLTCSFGLTMQQLDRAQDNANVNVHFGYANGRWQAASTVCQTLTNPREFLLNFAKNYLILKTKDTDS